MSEIIAITSTTLQDLNDAIIAGKEPVGELEDGILWLDTSKTPPVLKIRENGKWENANIDFEALDPDLAETITTITNTLGNIADDNKLTYEDRRIVLENIGNIIGYLPSNRNSTDNGLPDYTRLDSQGVGTFASYRDTAREVGVKTSDTTYISVQQTYTALASYLEGHTPKPWDISESSKGLITNLKDGDVFRQRFLEYFLAELSLVQKTEVLAKKLTEDYVDTNVSDTVHKIEEWGNPLYTDKAHEKGGVQVEMLGNSILQVPVEDGRNLAVMGNWKNWGGGATQLDDKTFRLNDGGSGAGIFQSGKDLNLSPNTRYVMTFLIRRIKGDLLRIGGHTNPNFDPNDQTIIIDGKEMEGVFHANGGVYYEGLNDGEWHTVTVKLITRETVYDNEYIYIQPNRVNYTGGEFEVSEIIFEKGSNPSAWAPAPEDVKDNIQSVNNFDIASQRDSAGATSGGRNLLTDSNLSVQTKGASFTVGGVTYNTYAPGYANYNAGISSPTTNYHSYIDNNTFGFPVVAYNESNGSRNWKGSSKNIKDYVRKTGPGEYTVSFDVFATGQGTKLFGGFYYFRKSDTGPGFRAGQYTINIDKINSWHRVSAVCTLGEDIDWDKSMYFYFYGYGFSTNSILYVRNHKLEKGTKATPWTPALEDVPYDTTSNGVYRTKINLPEPLRSIGDVKDRLFLDEDGKWKVERSLIEYTADGTETWRESPYGKNRWDMTSNSLPVNSYIWENNDTGTPIISSHFLGKPGSTGDEGDTYVYGRNVRVYSRRFSSPQDVVDYLKSNYDKGTPVTWVYRIAPIIETLPDEIQGKLNRIPSFSKGNSIYTVLDDVPKNVEEQLHPQMKATFKSRMWVEEQLRLLDAPGSSNQFNASDLLNAEDENGRTHVHLPALTQGDKYVVSTNAPKDIDVEFRHPYGTEKIYDGNNFTFIVEQGVTYTVTVPTKNLEYFTGYSEESPVFTGGEYIIQIERGATPSDFKPSDIDTNRREEDRREQAETNLLTIFDVRIEETQSSVRQTISETVYGIEREDGEIDENSLLYQLTSLVETTSNKHTIAFDELKKDLDSMDGELQQVRNSFQFNQDGTFSISASNSNASMELTKDALNFKNGDTVVASVSANELRINRGVFVEKITIGEYSFEIRNGQGVWSYEPRK